MMVSAAGSLAVVSDTCTQKETKNHFRPTSTRGDERSPCIHTANTVSTLTHLRAHDRWTLVTLTSLLTDLCKRKKPRPSQRICAIAVSSTNGYSHKGCSQLISSGRTRAEATALRTVSPRFSFHTEKIVYRIFIYLSEKQLIAISLASEIKGMPRLGVRHCSHLRVASPSGMCLSEHVSNRSGMRNFKRSPQRLRLSD